MSEFYASAREVVTRAHSLWKPPPKLTLSEWADAYFYLSAESSAQSGRWTTLPYQRGILDAITDPTVTKVSVMKSARVGFTKCMNAAIGYYIDQDPCSILVVQPTVEDAKGYSKEEVAPMLRDCPRLAKIIFEESEEKGPRDSANTILHKRYPGGVLSLVGANAGSGFRRISRRVVMFDEVDGYPPSAGSDGDPVKLGEKRTEYYWNRKIIAGSTPLLKDASRISELFEEGDQRRYFVPCPHCDHMDFLVFTERPGGGHFMLFEEDKPEEACFICSNCGGVIEHKDKRDMVARGEWRAAKPFAGHASFHVWTAYSFSPNATWAQIASEYVAAKKTQEQLKTFVNTVLGETWQESGDAPDWERLYQRRETYPIGTLPAGVKFLTAGVDVQKDRWVYEVVGWGFNKESWSIDAGVIPGDTSRESDWAILSELLNRAYEGPKGQALSIRMLAIDSGYNTQQVYNWGRRHDRNRVIAVKGVATARVLAGTPTPVDIDWGGTRIRRGYKVWPVGSSIGKAELYGFLRLQPPVIAGEAFPPGYCHFPEHGPDFFKQLTGEHLVTVKNKRTGHTVHEWQVIPGRENHFLDARVYARVAAGVVGIDLRRAPPVPAPVTTPEAPERAPVIAAAKPKPQVGRLKSVRGNGSRKPWLR